MYTDYDVIIAGAGAAGLSAGIYAKRAGLDVVIMEKRGIGGELLNRQLIENYPGFSEGIQGPMLAAEMTAQAENTGVEFMNCEVINVKSKNKLHTVYTDKGVYTSKAVIAATGSHPRLLNVKGEKELSGKGVFYCATCDGPMLAGKSVVVAGAGDSGITEALHLVKLGCKVTILEFMDTPKASSVLLERIEGNPDIQLICGARIIEIQGNDWVTAVIFEDCKTKAQNVLETEGVLVRIGMVPETKFMENAVKLTETGQIQVTGQMSASAEGIYGAGDIRMYSPAQFGTAAGDGITAAMAAARYIHAIQ